MRYLFLLVIILHLSNEIYSQRNISSLTLDKITKGEKFVGYLPTNISWSENNKEIYFDWNPDMKSISEMYRINVNTRKPVKMSITDQRNAVYPGGDYDKDFKRKVYVNAGDLILYDAEKETTRLITQTLDYEYNPIFSYDEKYILYSVGNNYFSWEISSGATRQLTNFIKGNKRQDGKKSDYDVFLEKQQSELFDVLKEQKKQSRERKTLNDSLRVERIKDYYFGERNLQNLTIDPKMKYVSFTLSRPGDSRVAIVPNFVTDNGFTRDIQTREKVGLQQSTFEMYIYNIKRDTAFTFDRNNLPGVYNLPIYMKEYRASDTSFNLISTIPKELIFMNPTYSEDGKAVMEIKSQDHKDRWIVLLNMDDASYSVLEYQHDEAWIGGPGISGYSEESGSLGWLADNETIWFQSEETGFSHLYTLNTNTKEKKQLTSGNYEILQTQLSRDKKTFYITSNMGSPFNHDFYKLSVTGSSMQRITYLDGNNDVYLSPNEKYLAVRYSYSNKPWELYLMENKPNAPMIQLTKSTTSEFEKYPWRVPEIIWFKASDGVMVPARIYKPANPNKAAVIFVHGAGYLQNVHNWWSNYYREYMFHNMLADNGYTVLDIDYRASDGYGRDWRTAIYRYMGGRDLQDHIDGAKYLVDSVGIDAKKLGIYGGSYGGFITLMALFKHPGVFKCGAALRSVTDWAHYNHGYTSNILNTPVEDSIAYKRSSPIYFADGLKDRLLILHGMMDINVHFQDVVRLTQRLIELRKENWEMAVFPIEDHGFKEPTSWADEYKRIYKMFDQELTN